MCLDIVSLTRRYNQYNGDLYPSFIDKDNGFPYIRHIIDSDDSDDNNINKFIKLMKKYCFSSSQFKDTFIPVWKVFNVENNKLKFKYAHKEKCIKYDTLLTANCVPIRTSDRQYYTSGFHCFLTKNDAKSFSKVSTNKILLKVYVKHVMHFGYQNNLPVVVAKNMKILESDYKIGLNNVK